MRPLLDCHNHSLHSFDGQEPVDLICRRAAELELQVFAITDHCDLYPARYPTEQVKAAICASVDEVSRWRQEHAVSTRILTGFELGEAIDHPALAEEILAMRPVDVVIGSIHRAGDIEDFYYLDCRNNPVSRILELLDDYFDRLIRLVEWGKADVLAHITYPLRYIVGDAGIPVELGPYEEKIDRLLRLTIDSGMALEVNSSGLRQKISVPLPDPGIVSRYRQLGGRRITLGSDAHKVGDIASGIPQCQQLLRELGFEELTWFRQRQPQTIRL